ncbi:unnamed protein product [Didymodactylos carnosus]|uniref:Uncharacterized protein n=1 Tax=Didymodactylos carnosus TaxID=1234261 RepID=A0A815JHM8_9BILA|nr:unnamed protein product [Didymodactylos carnosus]CAF4276026.1 unnamed protein product [Didymodactylos carnosus]
MFLAGSAPGRIAGRREDTRPSPTSDVNTIKNTMADLDNSEPNNSDPQVATSDIETTDSDVSNDNHRDKNDGDNESIATPRTSRSSSENENVVQSTGITTDETEKEESFRGIIQYNTLKSSLNPKNDN